MLREKRERESEEEGTGKRGGSRRAGCLCLGEEGRGMDSGTLDDIIARLLDVRSGRPGKQVQLSEAEIRQLCLTSKDIFLAQSNLLELEAPIKICGNVFSFLLLRRVLLVSFFVFSLVHHLLLRTFWFLSALREKQGTAISPPSDSFLWMIRKKFTKQICLFLLEVGNVTIGTMGRGFVGYAQCVHLCSLFSVCRDCFKSPLVVLSAILLLFCLLLFVKSKVGRQKDAVLHYICSYCSD